MFYDGVLPTTYKNIFKFLKVTLCSMPARRRLSCTVGRPAHRKCLLLVGALQFSEWGRK